MNSDYRLSNKIINTFMFMVKNHIWFFHLIYDKEQYICKLCVTYFRTAIEASISSLILKECEGKCLLIWNLVIYEVKGMNYLLSAY